MMCRKLDSCLHEPLRQVVLQPVAGTFPSPFRQLCLDEVALNQFSFLRLLSVLCGEYCPAQHVLLTLSDRHAHTINQRCLLCRGSPSALAGPTFRSNNALLAHTNHTYSVAATSNLYTGQVHEDIIDDLFWRYYMWMFHAKYEFDDGSSYEFKKIVSVI